MTSRGWLCFALSTVGILLITLTGDLTAGSNHLVGIGFGLLAACLYATAILLNKHTGELDGIERTLIQFLAATLVMLPYVALTSGFNLTHLVLPELSALLLLGILHTGIAYCMYFSSLPSLSGKEVAILSYVDPLVAVFCSAVLLKEGMTPPQIVGAALVLGFTLIDELGPHIRKKPDNRNMQDTKE
jgi:drug/metabolite transporter (DMT)-like permease